MRNGVIHYFDIAIYISSKINCSELQYSIMLQSLFSSN